MTKEVDSDAGRINERNDTARGKARYSGHLSRILKTKEQQQAMMKYLISIREKTVSEAEVIQVAVKISEMGN